MQVAITLRHLRASILSQSIVVFVAKLLILVLTVVKPFAVFAQSTTGVYVEAFVNQNRPFLQQTIIYTVRVYHGTGIKQLNPSPVIGSGFAIEKLAGPPETTRMLGRGGQATSDFFYALTPISDGRLEIPAVQIEVVPENRLRTGWSDSKTAQNYEIATQPVYINVKTPEDLSKPWLPLYGHRLYVQLDESQQLGAGEPVTLTITQNAWGVKGERLPKLASLITSDDFTIYADKSQTSWKLTSNGQMLLGQRIEPITLVPRNTGRGKIPPIKVAWWNLSQNHQSWSEWSGMDLKDQLAKGANSTVATDESATEKVFPAWLYFVLVALASFGVGWWIGRNGLSSTPLRKTLHWVIVILHWMTMRLKPHRWLPLQLLARLSRWLRTHLTALHPVWLEVMLLRSHIKTAEDARAVEHELQSFARHILGVSEILSVQGIAHELTVAYPKLDTVRLRELCSHLDAAIYGNNQTFILNDWKRDFEHVLNPASFYHARSSEERALQTLPELNPGYTNRDDYKSLDS